MDITGNLVEYFLVFWGGVLISFTPCVYPLLPITASFIGGMNPRGNKLTGFLISLVYVLGIAITYCTLGVIAALSGKAFGQIQNNPIIFIVVANVLIFFALVMLDVISIPALGVSLQDKIKKKTFGTVVLFGMAAGLVVGPCLSPVLGSLLAYVASKQNVVHGVSLLFVFSYGVGASLILVGTFVGILESLPKAGKWMLRIKQFCGIALIIIAQYFLVQAGKLMF